jgi:hypothetical protein
MERLGADCSANATDVANEELLEKIVTGDISSHK